MAEPGGLNLEAFKNSILAMMDELVIKQAEKFKEELKEENIKQIKKIDEINTKQTESLENRLEQQFENSKQDTIRITESLEELKNGNLEIKQSIIDSNAQLTEKIVDTNLRIDMLENNFKQALHEQVVRIENKQKELRLEWRKDLKETGCNKPSQ